MDIAAILREIDEEIRKLTKAREILEQHFGLAPRSRRGPAKGKPRKRETAQINEAVGEPVVTEVEVTVVPPRPRREYHRRAKALLQITRAIDVAVSAAPVFVPRTVKASVPEPPAKDLAGTDSGRLEAAMRKSLLGASELLSDDGDRRFTVD